MLLQCSKKVIPWLLTGYFVFWQTQPLNDHKMRNSPGNSMPSNDPKLQRFHDFDTIHPHIEFSRYQLTSTPTHKTVKYLSNISFIIIA